MFSKKVTSTQPVEKQFITLVLDHAIQGQRHVAFEMGAGMCGSSFPDYDYYMQGIVKPIEVSGQSRPCRSLMRRKMIGSVAKQVRFLYIVNASTDIILQEVDELWLQTLNNVRYFSSFERFCQEALAKPQELENCAVIVDRNSAKTFATENDYAVILKTLGINIPVINAEAYKVFDEKVTFTTLFTGNDEKFLPKTWIVDDNNYLAILDDIEASAIDQFVLKIPIMSHARDTVIVDKSEIRALICAGAVKDYNKIARLKLPATNRECLKLFFESLASKGFTFLIRELILPNPVKIGQHHYRAAARSVFTAVYDVTNKTLLHIECLDSYWQRTKEPFKSGRAITHDNLITSDIHSVKIGRPDGSMLTTTIDQQASLLKEFNVNCAWSDAEKDKYGPDVLEIAKTIVRGIVKNNTAEAVLALAKHPNPAIANHMRRFVLGKPVQCLTKESLQQIMHLSKDLTVFLSRQLVVALQCYLHHKNCNAVPAFMLKEIGAAFDNKQLNTTDFIDYITSYVMCLPDALRNELITYSKKVSPTFADVLENLVNSAVTEAKNAKSAFYDLGMNAFKKKDYPAAISQWTKLLSTLTYYLPDSEDLLTTHNNLGACYRELGNYQEAIQHFLKATTIAQNAGFLELAVKYNEKLYHVQQLAAKSSATKKLI